MKIFKMHSLVIIAVLACMQSCQKESSGASGFPDTPIEPPEESEFNYVYEQGENGYEVYRIPSIVKTESGALLAFAEARRTRSAGDSGDIDLVVKRSADDGETWSESITVWDDGKNTCGNPVPIVGKDGIIHLLMTWNNGEDKWGTITQGTGKDTRRPFYCYSTDDGKTWSDPVEITSAIKEESWNWYATGPCHGIMIKTGEHEGRLVSPNYFTVKESGKVVSYSHTAYSDDNGKTWHAGKPTPSGGVGECSVVELQDGTLMLNMRASDGFYRKYSTSSDGGETWSAPQTDNGLIDCACQGSIINDGNCLFFSNAASATERINITVKKSDDDGKTWSGQYIVYPGKSGYSDLVEISDDKVAVYYEGGKNRYTDGLDFKIISKTSIR